MRALQNFSLIFPRCMPLMLGFVLMLKGQSQSILIDHESISEFEKIPLYYKQKAEQTRLLFMDRSVGDNISQALNCLASEWSHARSYCKRWEHRDSVYQVDPKEVYWDGVWDRSLWRYEFWPSNCSENASCFINYVEPKLDSFDVIGCQFSYLAVLPGSQLADSVRGFFGSSPGNNHATILTNFMKLHPEKKMIWWTTSLARGIGSQESQEFNDQMRDFAKKNEIILFDVADILSHDPAGHPCFDNRDGVSYLTEQYPDDSLEIPAICPQYTTETDGGHLGSISAGGIRVAKAFWVLMAKLSGWNGLSTSQNYMLDHCFRIYPNPGNGHVIIKSEYLTAPVADITIRKMDGVLVRHWYSQCIQNYGTELDLSHLPKGIYIFDVVLQNQAIQKIYVQQ